MIYFKHDTAIVETPNVGRDTKVWAFVHILPGAKIGNECNICDHCFIENDVLIGDGVTLKCGIYLWDGVEIADDVFVGPNVVFTNDVMPRNKQYPEVFMRTIIRKGASIGANATLIASIEIGKYSMIGAGSVVTKNVPDFTLVYGNPARQHGYVCKCGKKLTQRLANAFSCECGKRYRLKKGKLAFCA